MAVLIACRGLPINRLVAVSDHLAAAADDADVTASALALLNKTIPYSFIKPGGLKAA
jgi:hypothetical protein